MKRVFIIAAHLQHKPADKRHASHQTFFCIQNTEAGRFKLSETKELVTQKTRRKQDIH